jgi:hypothetical protein
MSESGGSEQTVSRRLGPLAAGVDHALLMGVGDSDRAGAQFVVTR